MDRAHVPQQGLGRDQLLAALNDMRAGDVDVHGGRTWSMVYWAGKDHSRLMADASTLYLDTNGLNPLAFKSFQRMERDLVAMALSLMHAPDAGVGTVTSGGTESILMAVKAYRDRLLARRPWVRRAEIVAPESVHPAFDKAAHYLGLDLRLAPLGPDFRVDVAELERLVTRRTAMVVVSAPQYPHGVIDPVAGAAAMATRRRVPLHVDACFGGFLLPFLEQLGMPVAPWDFRVPGVCSISADLHKYAYAPKGTSVILYRDMSYLRHQFFVSTRYPGGIYASATAAGSRSGANVAAAWTSLHSLGCEGLLRLAREAMEAADRLRDGIRRIPGLGLLDAGETTIVAWTTSGPGLDLYAVADQLAMRGWSVDRQQFPPSVHCTVNASNAPVVDRYLGDLTEAVMTVRRDPSLATRGDAAFYGLSARIPVARITEPAVRRVLEGMYGAEPEVSTAPSPSEQRVLRTLVGLERWWKARRLPWRAR